MLYTKKEAPFFKKVSYDIGKKFLRTGNIAVYQLLVLYTFLSVFCRLS